MGCGRGGGVGLDGPAPLFGPPLFQNFCEIQSNFVSLGDFRLLPPHVRVPPSLGGMVRASPSHPPPTPPSVPFPPPKGCGGPQPEEPDRNAWASHTANRSPIVSYAFKHSGNIRSSCFPFVFKHSSPTLAFATSHFCHSEMPPKQIQRNKETVPMPPFPPFL